MTRLFHDNSWPHIPTSTCLMISKRLLSHVPDPSISPSTTTTNFSIPSTSPKKTTEKVVFKLFPYIRLSVSRSYFSMLLILAIAVFNFSKHSLIYFKYVNKC